MKCNNCSKEFEGKYCPDCGFPVEGKKKPGERALELLESIYGSMMKLEESEEARKKRLEEYEKKRKEQNEKKPTGTGISKTRSFLDIF